MARGIKVPKKEGHFDTKDAAKKYYKAILNKLNNSEELTNKEIENTLDLHHRYCDEYKEKPDKNGNLWPPSNGVKVARKLNNEPRSYGYNATYQLAVVTADGEVKSFGYGYAIDAIAVKNVDV